MPAIIFDRLPEDHVVQMFVTINAKHTRLNSSHLVSLSGRQLYRDEALAAAHDVVRALNDREDRRSTARSSCSASGKGRVAQAPLAQEFKRLFADEEALGGARKAAEFRDESQEVLRQLLQADGVALRVRVERPQVQHPVGDGAARLRPGRPDVMRAVEQQHAERTDYRAIGRVIAPWGRRIGALRFETDGAWKRQGTTVDGLAKELRLALQYPEGRWTVGDSSRSRASHRPDVHVTRRTPRGRPAFREYSVASLAPPSIYGTLP